ncbi:WD40-repeat-containing domain protein [Ephemerocybe angulata]|uniref:WD40-repeat-containing domain protein n=1 Tax=Ephemerocybe angulata TaxID=980116 RepID=A0A8H6M0U2_9AGAR|nr:WD40-repeat-containing domain protein [Tulosesus angulatus]
MRRPFHLFIFPTTREPPAMYTLKATILEHKAPINCLTFSDDGYLASGDDDGTLLITEAEAAIDEGGVAEVPDRYHFIDSITALLWMPGHCILVGLANCELHFLSLKNDQSYILNVKPSEYEDLEKAWKDSMQINSLAFDESTDRVAVAIGIWLTVFRLNEPIAKRLSIRPLSDIDWKAAVPAKGLSSEVRSLHFLPEGKGLLVTYLEEGIRCYDLSTCTEVWHVLARSYRIGRSAVDASGRYLVCSNLYDGLDIYDLEERCHIRTIHDEPDLGNNVVIPVIFIEDDTHILSGTTRGKVPISSTTDSSYLVQLDHGRDVIQSIAHLDGDYIATGGTNLVGGYAPVTLWERMSFDAPRSYVSKAISTQTQQDQEFARGQTTQASTRECASSTSTSEPSQPSELRSRINNHQSASGSTSSVEPEALEDDRRLGTEDTVERTGAPMLDGFTSFCCLGLVAVLLVILWEPNRGESYPPLQGLPAFVDV